MVQCVDGRAYICAFGEEVGFDKGASGEHLPGENAADGWGQAEGLVDTGVEVGA